MSKEEIVISKVKQVLKDFEKEYEKDQFDISTPEEVKEWWGSDKYTFDVWEVTTNVQQEQWGGNQGVFLIAVKDETLEPFMFHDGGAPGSVPNLEVIKKDGKYVIGGLWKK